MTMRAAPRRRLARHVAGAYAALVLVFLLAPLVVAVILSFSSGDRIEFPPPGFSLRWYEAALSVEQFRSGLWISVVIGLGTAALSAVGGTGAAIAFYRYRFAGRGLSQAMVMLPLSMPGIVVGLAILLVLPMLTLSPGIVACILGHSVLGIPYVAYLVSATLSNYDMTLEHAARNLGATGWGVLRDITLPLVSPGIVAGSLCAFLISFDNVALSLFLARGDTLPLRLMQYIQFYADPSVAAVSTFLVALSLGAMLVLGWFLRKRDTLLSFGG